MYNHAPEGYDCPFCRLAQGEATSVSSQDDVIYHDDDVTAFMAAGWWPNNRGHVLVVPTEHYENLYDLPPELGTPIQRVSRDVALAFKATYRCDGVSTRQHNEPDGNQDVWHYHVHVFPRFRNDNLYVTGRQPSTAAGRRPYAEKLRGYLDIPHRTDSVPAPNQRSGRSAPCTEREVRSGGTPTLSLKTARLVQTPPCC